MDNKLIFCLSLIILLTGTVVSCQRADVSSSQQSDDTFKNSVSQSDLERIFFLLVAQNLDIAHGQDSKEPIYIITNEFAKSSYRIRHLGRAVHLLTKEEFDAIQSESDSLLGYIEITDIQYGKNKVIKKDQNSVTVHYRAQWYGGDGASGFHTFTREINDWTDQGGYSSS